MARSHIGIATALTSLLFAVPAYADDPLRLAVDVPFEPFEYSLP